MNEVGQRRRATRDFLGGRTHMVSVKQLGVWGMISLLSVATLAAATVSDLRGVDAAKKGDKAAVRSLVKQHVNVNTPHPDGATALAWAAHWNDLETPDVLIAAAASP